MIGLNIIKLFLVWLGWPIGLLFILSFCRELPPSEQTADATAVPILVTNTPIPQPTLTPTATAVAPANFDPITPDLVVGTIARGQWLTGEIAPHQAEAWEIAADSITAVDITVRPESGFDLVVDVRNAQGESLLPNGPIDNSFGDEQVRQAPIPPEEAAYIVITGYGAASGSYELYMTPAGEVSGPVTGDAAYGQLERGRLEVDNNFHLWRFSGTTGDVINVTIRPLPDDLDVVVDIIDPIGLSILPNGYVDEAYGTEYIRGAVLPTSGEYLILVWGYQDSTGPYELELDLSHNGRLSHTLFGQHPLPAGQTKEHYFWAEAGDHLNAFVNPDFDFDLIVRLFDDNDRRLLEVDDRFGIEMVSWTAPAAGRYYWQIVGYEEAVSSGYALVLTADPTVQLSVRPGERLIVDLAAGETAVYTLTPQPNQQLHIHTAPLTDAAAPFLRLRTPDGNLVTEGTGHLFYTTPVTEYETYLLEVGPVNGRFYLYLDHQ